VLPRAEAAKYDPYMLGQLFLAGTLSEGDLLRLVDGRRFAVVQLLLPEIGAPVERAALNRLPGVLSSGYARNTC